MSLAVRDPVALPDRHREALDSLTAALMKRETITRDELHEVHDDADGEHSRDRAADAAVQYRVQPAGA